MKIHVKVMPRARCNSVEKVGETYIVRTTAVPESGKANAQVIALLAKHFRVGKSCVEIVRGHTSRSKVVHIVT